MEQAILRFVSCARAADLRISTAEAMACLSQLKLIDILDERQFYTVLRANFAKSRREQHSFDHLYHLYFHELQMPVAEANVISLEKPLQAVQEALRSAVEEPPELVAITDFVTGEPSAFLQLLQGIQSEGGSRRQGPGSNLGALVRRFPVLRALDRAAELVDGHLDEHDGTMPREIRRQIQQHLKQRLTTARELLTREKTFKVDNVKKDSGGLKKGLAGRSFGALSPEETIRLRDAISELVRKLKDRAGLRYAVRSRGALDVKKTLRRAARFQGVPVEIIFRQKPPRKARITVLCDISGSVWSTAKFMLNVLYSLQECFERVRSFVFVAEVAEVTHFFDDHPVDPAIGKILSGAGINYEASTDYGFTLRQFRRHYMDAVSPKTTVIVIGDGRSNYANPETTILEEIRDRCRRLIWLNPEDERFWNTGDSEMRSYRPLCNELRPCRNLNDLSSIIKELVL